MKSRVGRGEAISAADRWVLFTAMADYTPEELLIGGGVVDSCPARQADRYGRRGHDDRTGCGYVAAAARVHPQRPARRAYRQKQTKLRAWLEKEYPAIAARAEADDAVIAWADQCGLGSDTAPPARSWAPEAATAVVRVNGTRLRVKVITIAFRGGVWFSVFTASVHRDNVHHLPRSAGPPGRPHNPRDRRPASGAPQQGGAGLACR